MITETPHPAPRILLVEDDPKLAALVKEYLEQSGLTVEIEPRGDRAPARILGQEPDLVILDLMLPGLDGLSVCKEVRPSYGGAILMLTARGDEVDEVVGLELLIQELLTYIRAGDRALKLDRQAVPPGQALAELAERLGEVRPEVTLELPADAAELPDLDADPRHLRRALKNLLHNALRHAEAKVVVRHSRRENLLLLSICDDGPGVPAEHRQQVFEPFARLDHSRSRESGGVGLGLAIVKEIAAAHGGEVSVAEAPEGGAMFTLA